MIFLAHTAADPAAILDIGGVDDVFALTDALVAIDAELTRSKLYHLLKAIQPDDHPLLVAELTEAPKILHMAPGSQAWLRDHLPGPPR